MSVAKKLIDTAADVITQPAFDRIDKIKQLSKKIKGLPPTVDPPGEVMEDYENMKEKVDDLKQKIKDAEKQRENAEKTKDRVEKSIEAAKAVIKANELAASPLNPVAVGIKQAQEFIKEKFEELVDNLGLAVTAIKDKSDTALNELEVAMRDLESAIKRKKRERDLVKRRRQQSRR